MGNYGWWLEDRNRRSAVGLGTRIWEPGMQEQESRSQDAESSSFYRPTADASSPTPRFPSALLRLLMLVVAIALACIWVLVSAEPAFAQAKTINYSNTELIKRDFSDSDMEGAVFVSAEMREANFQGTNLKNAILTMGNLLGADLSGANLEGALIDRATLYKANLTDAILVGATLTRSILDESIITGADFSDALIDRYTITQLCKRAAGINSVTGIATRDSLGCR